MTEAPREASTEHRTVLECRICRSSALAPVLDLGSMPLANAFVEPQRRERPERRFPLVAVRCAQCGLVQLSVVVRPDILFAHYLYSSSASAPMVSHFEELAEHLALRAVAPGALAVEFGSNDGVLLRPLKARGLRVLGVEPAENLAATANAAGLETLNEFFGAGVAGRIRSGHGSARYVIGNNVLAHIDDLHDVVEALLILLADDGVFVAEVPYLADLLDHVEYDTIYHEHLSYFHLAPLDRLFSDRGLEIFDLHRLRIHGGSIRIFVGRRGAHARQPVVDETLRSERAGGPATDRAFERFAARVAASRDALRSMLRGDRAAGRRVAALGATAKGTTLLNYCGIGPDLVEWIADSTPLKHGLLAPGTHIPVVPEERIVRERPERTLLLAWNYADAIVPRYEGYLRSGGRFIHPIPMARLIPS